MILSKRSTVLILFSILVLSTASIGMITYMPQYLKSLGTSGPLIQIIMTIFPLTLFIFPPLLGKYSDKLQKRILFVLMGAVGTIFSFLMLIITRDLILIVLFSFMYGFFVASYRIIFTLYSEIVGDSKRYISIYNALSTGGWFLGSFSGGIFIDIFNIQKIFLYLSIISLINLLIVVFIKENRAKILEHHRNKINSETNNFNKEKPISTSVYVGLFFRNFGIKPIMTILSVIMGQHLVSTTLVGFLIGLNFLIQVALMLLIGHVTTEKNNKIILIIGYFFSGIAIVGYIFAIDFFGFLVAQIFVAFSYSMFWSASVIYIAQNTTPKNKGRFMGYANTSTFSGGFLGGLFFSLLLIIFNENYDVAMGFMIIFPLIAALIILLRFKAKQKRAKSSKIE